MENILDPNQYKSQVGSGGVGFMDRLNQVNMNQNSPQVQHTPFSMTGRGFGNFVGAPNFTKSPSFTNASLGGFSGLPTQQPQQPTNLASTALPQQNFSQFSAGADKSAQATQIKQALTSKGVPPDVIAQQLKALGLV